MRSIQLYATGSATGNAIAQVTIPSATTLTGVCIAVSFDSITDGAAVKLELSRIPTTQIDTNGVQDNPFWASRFFGNFVTSGLAQGGINQFYPLDVSCRQGEIIYIHAEVAGTVVYDFNAIFYFR